ncbi:MAG: hypothetical protein ABI898_06345 [Sphingomonadales bacterium]
MHIKLTALTFIALPAALIAQPQKAPEPNAPPKETVGSTMADIATQPAQDVNLRKKQIPAVLVQAKDDPYSTAGARTCPQIGSAISNLTAVLGRDFDSKEEKARPNRGKQAASVGKAVVQSLIPFRGVIREISGAAGAQRDYDTAVDAGIARRGFLRGTARAKGCRVPT